MEETRNITYSEEVEVVGKVVYQQGGITRDELRALLDANKITIVEYFRILAQ